MHGQNPNSGTVHIQGNKCAFIKNLFVFSEKFDYGFANGFRQVILNPDLYNTWRFCIGGC